MITQINQVWTKYGMTFEEIARELGVSPQCIQVSFKNGMRKIKSHPQGRFVLRSLIEAARKYQVSPIGCGSLECRADYIELFAFDDLD